MNLSFDFQEPATTPLVTKPVRTHWRDGDPSAPRSPWGPVQWQTDYQNGVIEVVTAGHGGIKVTGKLAQKIPAAFRLGAWYEEDGDALIPLYFLYDDLKALADQLSLEECQRLGFISAVKTRTKQAFFDDLNKTGAYAARFDFMNQTTRALSTFSCDWDRRNYQYVMDALKNPPPTFTELCQGALIRFETPICFVIQNVEIHVQDFRITKYGKAIRFSPVGYNFLARISKWRERKFSLIQSTVPA